MIRKRLAPLPNDQNGSSGPNDKRRYPGRPKGSKNGFSNGKKRIRDPYRLMTPAKAGDILDAHEAEIKRVQEEFKALEDRRYAEEIAGSESGVVNLSPSVAKQLKRRRKKHPGGRPTKYKDRETCIQIIRLMSVGMGLLEAACEIGVLYDTVRRWRKEHAEFSVAVNIGQKLCEKWWREMGRNAVGEGAKNFNATLWMMNMTNRFNWVRKDERTETVKGSKTVTHTHKHVVEEIAKRSSEHTAEVVRILVEAGVLSAEAQKASGSTLH
jgi:hypothetical protein